jgi:hypothetical protein
LLGYERVTSRRDAIVCRRLDSVRNFVGIFYIKKLKVCVD